MGQCRLRHEVPHDLRATAVTLRHVTAKHGGTAGLDIAHHTSLAARQTMPLPVDLAIGAEDGSDLKRWLGLMFDRGAGTHGLGLWRGASFRRSSGERVSKRCVRDN